MKLVPSSPVELSSLLTPAKADPEDLTPLVILNQPQAAITGPQITAEISAKKQSSRAIFGSTFLTIFLAEFGDKTQLSILLMSAESQAPWMVFLGSASALITTSLLGVLLGRWLGNKLAPKTMEKAAGITLLLVALMLLWDVVQF